MTVHLPTIKQLQYLVALRQHGHFGKAAEACFVTQSTMSAGLRDLETSLGIVLVERTRRIVRFTALGEKVADKAVRVLREAEELAELARGVGASAERAGCPIIGGNVTRARELSLTITVLGSAAHVLRRSGALPGDLVYVTGLLGGPAAALRALQSGHVPAPAHMIRFTDPQARLAEAHWLAGAGATAAIDVSDGLGADVAHLARASVATIELEAANIPHLEGVSAEDALRSGEEYELVMTFAPDAALDVAQFERRFGIPLTHIGEVREAAGEPVRADGACVDPARGHDHLS